MAFPDAHKNFAYSTITGTTTNTFTVTRTTESSNSRNIKNGDQFAASITAKTLTDIEGDYMNSWSPYVLASAGTGLQTLQNASGNSSSGSLFVFPVTVPNQIR